MHLNFHKKDSLEKIKEATLLLLLEGGTSSITMRKVAKEAGVALGQVTYYYHTKESLILSVIQESLDVFYNEFKRTVDESEDKVNTILELFRNVTNEDDKIIKLFLVIISQSMYNAKIKKLVYNFTYDLKKYVKSVYDEAHLNLTEEEKELRIRENLGKLFESGFEKLIGIDQEVK